MIQQKAEKIKELSAVINPSIFENQTPPPIIDTPATDELPEKIEDFGLDSSEDYDDEDEIIDDAEVEVPTVVETEDEDTLINHYDNDDANQHDSDEEIGEIWASDFVEPEKMEIEPEMIDEALEDEEEPEADEDEALPEDDLYNQEVIEDEDYTDTDNDDPYTDEPEYVEDDEEDTLTVDELLRRGISKNIHKAFSLNDRFRFRRELFENSELEMNNTLNLVAAMNAYTEAEDYFYGDLEWDKDSPEVSDFMAIIKSNFL